jgi:hypothetical protein
MATRLGQGVARRAGLLVACSALCWAGFTAGGAAYASSNATDNPHGNSGTSTSAHDNGHGKDDANKSSSSSSSSDHSSGTAGTSGDPSQPQPPSNADQNSGGANGQCPGGAYCSTRDGSPSGNGNGNGNATGKPCAGCVGKADNKNPKGQQPGGSDHNAGYECDRNHGIGRSNPAHTGCTTSSSTPPSGSSGGSDSGSSTPPGSSVGGTSEGQCAGGAMTTPCTPTTSTNPPGSAGCPGGEMVQGACVSGVSLTRTPSGASDPSARGGVDVAAMAASRGPLPFTGSSTVQLLALALCALLTGTACVVLGRRRQAA